MSKFDSMRNAFVRVVCNWLLEHVATEDYARKIDGLIKQGMFYARTDPHAPWQDTEIAKGDQ